MEQKFCQCCGMPMGDDLSLFGTEADGSKSEDYCFYCYERGEFNFPGTMEEMIDLCVPPMVQANPGMTAKQAREMMMEFFPKLKRWQKEI